MGVVAMFKASFLAADRLFSISAFECLFLMVIGLVEPPPEFSDFSEHVILFPAHV